jgi:pyridinium-3,5-bisthiocarboxylic acid mononucleotide nickel chelatase
MRVLYFDCFAGVAGDMTLGALLELGVPLTVIEAGLAALPYRGYRLESARVKRHGICGTSFRVRLDEADQPHRHYDEIARAIAGSSLKESVRSRAGAIFRRLAEAEGKVHGVAPEKVHCHEVGAIDSIVDIVGTAIAIDQLGVDRICASGLPWGSGFVQTAHGLLPVPPPAVAELMQGIPLTGPVGPGERVTPTGAAIVATLADSFGAPPPLRPLRVGYGAGEKDFPDLPNLLRLVLGEEEGPEAQVLVLETHIDDMPPEIFGFLMERLLEEGALDVAFAPIQMKKNRPAVRLTVLCRPVDLERLSGVILSESTAIGLRYYPAQRITLGRRCEERATSLGKVTVKVMENGRVTPEFEECRRIALAQKLPLLEVYRIVAKETGAP